MILAQRVMVGTEMSRYAPITNDVVEHAVQAGAIDRAAVHVESDPAAGAGHAPGLGGHRARDQLPE